jgi:predicted nucleic-acid-binding Zn-ribbon protein
MRNTHRCPKCTHPRVIYLPAIADQSPGIIDRSLFAPQEVLTEVRPLSAYVDASRRNRGGRVVHHGKFEAYICEACGYSELYVKNANEIPIAKIPGAKILEARDAVPYR